MSPVLFVRGVSKLRLFVAYFGFCYVWNLFVSGVSKLRLFFVGVLLNCTMAIIADTPRSYFLVLYYRYAASSRIIFVCSMPLVYDTIFPVCI